MTDVKLLSTEELIEQIKHMSVLQLSELVKAIEETFDVSAAAPVAMAAAPAAGDAGAGAAEQTEFNVMLTSFGDNKINVIKAVRAITGLGLKEAKEMVEGVPSAVKEGADKEEAEKIKAQLEEAGASVELK